MKTQKFLTITLIILMFVMPLILAATQVSLITIGQQKADASTNINAAIKELNGMLSISLTQQEQLNTKLSSVNDKLDKASASIATLQTKYQELAIQQSIDSDKQTAFIDKLSQVQSNLDNAKASAAAATSAGNEADKQAKVSDATDSLKKARTNIIASQTGLNGWESMAGVGSMGKVLRYIFGPVTEITENQISSAIITIAVWLLIMLTFGDIISSFSTFSRWVSWSIAVLIGIIAANLNFATTIIAWFTGGFAIFGITSVYAGLIGAFVVFIIINLGITKLGGWVMGRKDMISAEKSHVASKAGGKKVAGAIGGIREIGKELEKF